MSKDLIIAAVVAVMFFLPWQKAIAKDDYANSITYKDTYSKKLVNSVYFDCFEVSERFDGRYVKLVDAIKITIRTRPPGVFKVRFSSRPSGIVNGVGTMNASGTPFSMNAITIEANGNISFLKLYNQWLIDEMCKSDGRLGPYSAGALGVNKRQWKSATEMGFN